MKNILLTAFISLFCTQSWGETITLSQARQLASGYMKTSQEPTLIGGGKRMSARRVKSSTGQTSNPPYYIFSRGQGQGFVIVGGDDLLPQIIGYTEQGDFDEENVPDGLRDLLYGYEMAIEKYQAYVAENGEEAALQVVAKAKARRAARRKALATTNLGPLMSSSWEQGWPYYDYCPWDTDNNARSLVGCVATSTSSVIHYWKLDNPRYLMTGTHAYTSWTHKLPVDPGYAVGHPMKWKLMQNSYGGTNYGSYNDFYTCVSELCAIVGDLVDMDYGSDGSGAQSSNQPTALAAFNLTGTNVWYSGVNDMDTWEEMIQGDLMKGRPILYSGYSVDSNNNWSGHAFVIDGYKLSDGKYHLDLGWGASWKGYYALSDCNGFNTDQSMTYQIYPKKLNLTAQVSAPTFMANTNNTVTVTVQNNGTLDYTEAINLFCSTSPNVPTSWGDQLADYTTIPAGGEDVNLTFTVNPGSGDSWYIIVVDKDFHVLARVKVPTTETLTEVTSTYITNPSFELFNSSQKPTGWTLGTSGQYSRDAENSTWYAVGHDGSYVLDSWVSGDTGYGIYQTLKGLPSGYYRLTAKVATDPGNTVTVYAGDSTVTTGAHECGKYYLQDVIIDRVYVSSTGQLKIGIQPGSWYKADDFRLYRYLVTPEEPQTSLPQNAAEGKEYFDITDAMAPWLSTASLGSYTNDGFAVGTWGNYTGSDGSSLKAPFIEKWRATGSYLDNASIQQTIRELPNGRYYIGGSFIATSQGVDNDHIEGVTFWAGDKSLSLATGNGAPELYAIEVEVTDGTLTFGLKTDCTTANWVAVDNLFLYWAGDEQSYYAQASSASPVRVPINNPRMEESLTGWTLAGSWQSQSASYNNFDPDFMECWTNYGSQLSDRSAIQMLNLYAGTYRVAAAVNATQQGDASVTVSGVNLKLGSSSVACHTANKAPEVFTTSPVTVEAGYTIMGLYVANTTANWVAWDNVVLYCYGADVQQTEDEYWRILRLCQQAKAEYESTASGAATSALAQYTWTEAEYATKSSDEIAAAISVLTNGTTIAAASQYATSLVKNADFKGSVSSLSVQGSGGRVEYPGEWTFSRTYSGWNDTYVDTGAGLFNAWAGTITLAQLSQTVSSLPNGTYRLWGDIRVDNPVSSSQTTLYGTSGSETTHSDAAGSDIAGSTTDFATYSVTFSVTGNTATIGILSQHSFFQLKNVALEFVTSSVGDVTKDGRTNLDDAIAISRIILGHDSDQTQYNHTAADLNNDGHVSMADLTRLIKVLLTE